MADGDVEVDLQALVDAAEGMSAAVEACGSSDVEGWVPTSGDLADDGIWAATQSFMNRWQIGLDAMVEDVGAASGALGRIAQTYVGFEQDATRALTGKVGHLAPAPRPGV